MSMVAAPQQQAGVHRAVYLSGDLLGNCQVMVPAVAGQVPLDAHSAAFTTATPGDVGWVAFEAGDTSAPVWLGTMAVDQTVALAHWNSSWGVVDPGVSTASAGLSSVSGTQTIATLLFTPDPNRLYRLWGRQRLLNTGSAAANTLSIADNANVAIGNTSMSQNGAAGELTSHFSIDSPRTFTPDTGLTTKEIRLRGSSSIGTWSTNGNYYLYVEDCGPAVIAQILVGPPVLSAPSNTSFGVLDYKAGVHTGTTYPANTNVFATVLKIYQFDNMTFQADRRYEIRFRYRAATTATPYFLLYKDGVFFTDYYATRDSGTTYGGGEYSWELNGNDHLGTHQWTIGVSGQSAATGTIFTNGDSASVRDLGPSTGPLTIVPAPTVTVPGGWQTPVYQNSWVDYGAPYRGTRYRIDGDMVFMEGTAKTGASSTVMFTLPVGFRPLAMIQRPIRAVDGTEQFGLIEIATSGTVLPVLSASAGPIDAISFGFEFPTS